MDTKDLKTPCYIIDKRVFEENIRCFKKALKRRFKNSIVGYSFKTNSLPAIISIANKCGCYAEVVSDDEYRLSREIGFDSARIIFNGPVKSKELLFEAVRSGSIVNVDSQRELEWLCELAKSVQVHIGLRVNLDLEQYAPGETITKEMGGRFGFCYENGSLGEAINLCKNNGVSIDGLHLHTSSLTKSQNVYRVLTRMALRIAQEERLTISYIDLGGSFFGGNDGGRAYEKYVEAIADEMGFSNSDLTIIVEPGASVISTAVSYLVEVVDTKKTSYNQFVITNGTRLHVDPFFRKSKYQYVICCDNGDVDLASRQIICGCTCMENDRIFALDNYPSLARGDRIQFDNVGSYTMCFNALFITYYPYVYMKDGQTYTICRNHGTYRHVILGNNW